MKQHKKKFFRSHDILICMDGLASSNKDIFVNLVFPGRLKMTATNNNNHHF